MKNFIFQFIVVLALLFGYIDSWAQIDFNAIQDPNNWYYVVLQAHVSSTSCGTNPGEVQLMYTDVRRHIVNEKPVNPYLAASEPENYEGWNSGYAVGFADAEAGNEKETNKYPQPAPHWTFYDGYDAGYDWYNRYGGEDLNVQNPTEFGATVSSRGYAQIHLPGVDSLMDQISTYAYFFGKVRENDGWYFTGWSFTEGGSDLGGNAGEQDSLLFKIYPGDVSGIKNATTQHVYASFAPVQVSDYSVEGLINIGMSAGSSGSTTVVYEVLGARTSKEDFAVSVLGENYEATIVDCQDNKVTVEVRYTNPGGIEESVYKGEVSLVSKSGCSGLTASVYARVMNESDTEASLYVDKEKKQSGTLAQMISASANYEHSIISLNRDYTQDLVSNSSFVLDLNGYSISGSLRVESGELTIAYSKYGGRILNTIYVNGGRLQLDGSMVIANTGVVVSENATFVQNGATINATETAIENSGTTIISEGLTSGKYGVHTKKGELLVNDGQIQGGIGVLVESGMVELEKGVIVGDTGVLVKGGSVRTKKYITITGEDFAIQAENGDVLLYDGRFDASVPLAGEISLQGGYFKKREIGIDLTAEQKWFNVLAGPEYEAGYRYFAGNEQRARQSGVSICKIGTTAYASLEDALAYANNNVEKEVTIIMLNDYELPSGYYTLPAKATLIVPMSDTQETGYPIINRLSNNSISGAEYIEPYEFRRLTLAPSVHIEVHGTIEISGSQRASDDAYASMPYGAYGCLEMSSGAEMVLHNGSELRAWGYMTGEGLTVARRGSTVREQFQIGDWKGGGLSFDMLSDSRHVFPITQYFIQNIESPVEYHPGAVLSTTTSVSAAFNGMAVTASANDIKIIGVAGRDEAMFLMDNNADADNTWVRKWYDSANDVQTYDVNSAAHIGSMVLDLGKLGTTPLVMNSGAFILPITNNMKIHLLSGYMDFTQSTSLLAGAEVEVNKKARVSISKNLHSGIQSGALYVYDSAEWDTYACGKVGSGYEEGKYVKVVKYSPSWDGQPTKRNENMRPASAKINVHGTFDTDAGYVYTTSSGANIFSTNSDAGTFTFTSAAATASQTVYLIKNGNQYQSTEAISARLRNGEGETPVYAETTGTEAGQSYCYFNERWTLLEMDEDDECFVKDNYGQYYAKPSGYVAIAANKDGVDITGNADHTYSDAAGNGKLYILLRNGCQWWEVENVENLYHCVHPDNDTYYYWGLNPETLEEEWIEKKCTITWQNWDGKELITYDAYGLPQAYCVKYGTTAEYLGSNPTREADIDYTYDFIGWTPELSRVTSDVTYTATYTKRPRKYTIIFQTEGGVEIERQFLEHNAIPACENIPTKPGHYLEWQPAIAAVTGDAVYTAHWLEEKPTEYLITFVDYDGETELQKGYVAAGTIPTYDGIIPHSKPATKEYTYEFDHWTPALKEATENMTYTAIYKEQVTRYKITFYDIDGETEIESTYYAYGAIPECDRNMQKPNTAEYTYIFAWEPQIQTVTGDAIYFAKYDSVRNQYAVNIQSTNESVCVLSGAGIYEYGTSVSISVQVNSAEYEFVGWQEDNQLPQIFDTIVRGPINLMAKVQKKAMEDLVIPLGTIYTTEEQQEIKDLYVYGDGIENSSQLKDAQKVKIWGDAYYVFTQNMEADKWYAIAFPWQVDCLQGVLDENKQRMIPGVDFDVKYFNGAMYAAGHQIEECWQSLMLATDQTLYPGQFYLITMSHSRQNVLFRKKAKTNLSNETIELKTYPSANITRANWNAIANPALYHSYLDANVAIAQNFNPTKDDYSPFEIKSNPFVIGQACLIQVPEPKTIVANEVEIDSNWSSQPSSTDLDSVYVTIAITDDGQVADRLFIGTTAEPKNNYVIGQDVAKVAKSNQKAQIWMESYGTELCKTVLTADKEYVDFPFAFSVTRAGTYGIYIENNNSNNVTLNLMLDGEVLWDLTRGSRSLSIGQSGVIRGYSLRLAPKSSLPTNIDETRNQEESVNKIIRNGHVYIIRGEDVYDLYGNKVKLIKHENGDAYY